MDRVWGVVVAAGLGVRFGAQKQFWELDGERLVDRAVRVCAGVCDGVVVALPPGVVWDGPAVDAAVEGGDTRSASVRAALAQVPAAATIVVVHDAARPLASRAALRAVVDAVRAGADGAIPVVAVSDTLKRARDGLVVETLDRDEIVAVQTPQAFRADQLRRAHADARDATDDAALVEAVGARVVTVPGDPANIKVTSPGDLELARALAATIGSRS